MLIKKYLVFLLVIHLSAAHANFLECLKGGIGDAINFGHATFAEINADTSLENLSQIHTHLKKMTNNRLVKNVEARRLIDPKDWKDVQDKDNAWQVYGDKTMQDWFEGREYILSLPKNQTIDSRLLKEIHKIVTKNHKFHGFEGRRLLQKLREGKITRQEFDTLKKRIYIDNEELAGISHSSLKGVFRQDSIDQVIHKGSSFREDGSRYFTQAELDTFRKNKYVTVDESSIKKIGNNAYTGTSFYESVDNIEKSIESIFTEYTKKLERAQTPRDIVKNVVSMEKDLISVHPFLDGNGRSIRLLGDYILNKYDLPPSLYPNEQDLTMPLEEAVEFRIQGMKDYIKEHQKNLSKLINKQ